MTLGWRRFQVLLSGLPADSRTMGAFREIIEQNTPGWWKKHMDVAMGRPVQRRVRVHDPKELM